MGGDTVTGPCNSANVSLSVDVCGSVAHVIDAVLLPASFCADSAQTEVGEDEDEDEDDDDDKDGDLESEDDAGALDEATIIDTIAEATSPENCEERGDCDETYTPGDVIGGTAEDDVEEISEGGDEGGESIDEEIDGYFEEGR